jgi:hypothetical protein
MAPQRCFRLITILLFVSDTFPPVYGQDPPLNGFDDYVTSLTLVQGSGPSLVLLPKQ